MALPYATPLTAPDPLGFDAATYAKYWMTFLVFSVLPAPDSPVHRIDWSSRSANGGSDKRENSASGMWISQKCYFYSGVWAICLFIYEHGKRKHVALECERESYTMVWIWRLAWWFNTFGLDKQVIAFLWYTIHECSPRSIVYLISAPSANSIYVGATAQAEASP